MCAIIVGMGDTNLKENAIFLRKKGLSYGEIRKEIGVSKSTLSYWLKDISLTLEQKERFYTKQILFLSFGAKSQKERRKRQVEDIINKASREIILPLSLDVYRLMGAALYWAEGSKGGIFRMTNSDPHLILFMVHWLKKVFGISASGLKTWLNIYPQQNELEIKSFWSELTGIPMANFGKTYIKPLSSGYKKNNLYYGTIRVQVPKSTDMKHRIFGWIKGALIEIQPEVDLLEKKWESLSRTPRPINL